MQKKMLLLLSLLGMSIGNRSAYASEYAFELLKGLVAYGAGTFTGLDGTVIVFGALIGENAVTQETQRKIFTRWLKYDACGHMHAPLVIWCAAHVGKETVRRVFPLEYCMVGTVAGVLNIGTFYMGREKIKASEKREEEVYKRKEGCGQRFKEALLHAIPAAVYACYIWLQRD